MTDHIAADHKFYEIFTTGEVLAFDQILVASWQPMAPVPGNPGGPGGQKGTVAYLQSVFSDIHYTVEEIYECAPDVATRHLEDFFGVHQQHCP